MTNQGNHSIVSSPFSYFHLLDAFFDKRRKVPNPLVYPWSIHGLVISSFQNGVQARGTGTLISKNSFLTAAHCLYHFDHSCHKFHAAQKVHFIPGGWPFSHSLFSEREILSVQASESTGYLVHEEYLNRDDNYDFGIVKLSADLGLQTGYASIVVLEDEVLERSHVNVSGYPGQKGVVSTFFKKPVYDMYTMKGQVTSVRKQKFHYGIDTSGGQSGAGVWIREEDDIISCCGVHVTGSKEEGNGAVRITSNNLETIKEWLKKLNLQN